MRSSAARLPGGSSCGGGGASVSSAVAGDSDVGTPYFEERLPWTRKHLAASSGGWDLEAFEGFLPQVSREDQSWLLCPRGKGSSSAGCQLFRQCRTREGALLILAKRRWVLPKTQTRLLFPAFGELLLGTVLPALPGNRLTDCLPGQLLSASWEFAGHWPSVA
ncbi:hypothetical protein E2320_006860 [Naja naja]|nr:hypothetical protein E2320_006860 [Naja naja]